MPHFCMDEVRLALLAIPFVTAGLGFAKVYWHQISELAAFTLSKLWR